jgi:hypothetical protein
VAYLFPDGTTETRRYEVAPMNRLTVWVDDGSGRLEDTAVSMRIVAENGVPIVAERAMWWPGGWPWGFEGHSSQGATASGTRVRE